MLLACQPQQDELTIKQAELKEKTAMLRALQGEIDILQKEVEVINAVKRLTDKQLHVALAQIKGRVSYKFDSIQFVALCNY